MTWKESGESFDIVATRAKLRVKFGVLRVMNQPRSARNHRFNEGLATNLKAEMSIKMLGLYAISGAYSPSTIVQQWSNPRELSWYEEGWHDTLHPPSADQGIVREAIAELKRISASPIRLLTEYLRKKSIDMLPVGYPAYLLLFYTIDGKRSFYSTSHPSEQPIGRYHLRVTPHSFEIKPRTSLYELDIKDWKDFTITERKAAPSC